MYNLQMSQGFRPGFLGLAVLFLLVFPIFVVADGCGGDAKQAPECIGTLKCPYGGGQTKCEKDEGKSGIVGRPCIVYANKIVAKGTCCALLKCSATTVNDKPVESQKDTADKVQASGGGSGGGDGGSGGSSPSTNSGGGSTPNAPTISDPSGGSAQGNTSESLLSQYGYTPQTVESLQKMMSPDTNINQLYQQPPLIANPPAASLQYDPTTGKLTPGINTVNVGGSDFLRNNAANLQPLSGSEYSSPYNTGRPMLWNSAVQTTGWTQPTQNSNVSAEQSWWQKAIEKGIWSNPSKFVTELLGGGSPGAEQITQQFPQTGPRNQLVGEALAQAVAIGCAATGCDPKFTLQALGGVCNQESQCDPKYDFSKDRCKNCYLGFGQLNENQTRYARDTLANLAQNQNLTAEQRVTVEKVVADIDSAMKAMEKDPGKNPNFDSRLGPWLLTARQMDARTDLGTQWGNFVETAASHTGEPSTAAATMQTAQLCPSCLYNFNPDKPLTSAQISAFENNGIRLSSGNTVEDAISAVERRYSNLGRGVQWASNFTPFLNTSAPSIVTTADWNDGVSPASLSENNWGAPLSRLSGISSGYTPSISSGDAFGSGSIVGSNFPGLPGNLFADAESIGGPTSGNISPTSYVSTAPTQGTLNAISSANNYRSLNGNGSFMYGVPSSQGTLNTAANTNYPSSGGFIYNPPINTTANTDYPDSGGFTYEPSPAFAPSLVDSREFVSPVTDIETISEYTGAVTPVQEIPASSIPTLSAVAPPETAIEASDAIPQTLSEVLPPVVSEATPSWTEVVAHQAQDLYLTATAAAQEVYAQLKAEAYEAVSLATEKVEEIFASPAPAVSTTEAGVQNDEVSEAPPLTRSLSTLPPSETTGNKSAEPSGSIITAQSDSGTEPNPLPRTSSPDVSTPASQPVEYAGKDANTLSEFCAATGNTCGNYRDRADAYGEFFSDRYTGTAEQNEKLLDAMKQEYENMAQDQYLESVNRAQQVTESSGEPLQTHAETEMSPGGSDSSANRGGSTPASSNEVGTESAPTGGEGASTNSEEPKKGMQEGAAESQADGAEEQARVEQTAKQAAVDEAAQKLEEARQKQQEAQEALTEAQRNAKTSKADMEALQKELKDANANSLNALHKLQNARAALDNAKKAYDAGKVSAYSLLSPLNQFRSALQNAVNDPKISGAFRGIQQAVDAAYESSNVGAFNGINQRVRSAISSTASSLATSPTYRAAVTTYNDALTSVRSAQAALNTATQNTTSAQTYFQQVSRSSNLGASSWTQGSLLGR